MKARRKSELSAILEEESERLKELLVLYRKKLENLPKGYLAYSGESSRVIRTKVAGHSGLK